MTIRVNKSEFNIREKLTELERPVGTKGNQIIAAETVQEARDLVSAGRKNLIINGDMRIAQRGTSGTKIGNSYGGYLSLDRWAVYYDDTIIAQTDVTINGRFKKACKVTAGGSNGRTYFYQKIEHGSRFFGDGTPFSISFWARASRDVRHKLNWRYYNNGAETTGSNQDITNFDLTTDWKYYKFENISILDANYNQTRDCGLWLFNTHGNDIGTGMWVEFTEIQVEKGKQCTEFEHRLDGEELMLCHRYFQKIGRARGSGNRDASSNNCAFSHNITPMRATPNCEFHLQGSDYNHSAKAFSNLNEDHVAVLITITNADSYWYYNHGYTADAEL